MTSVADKIEKEHTHLTDAVSRWLTADTRLGKLAAQRKEFKTAQDRIRDRIEKHWTALKEVDPHHYGGQNSIRRIVEIADGNPVLVVIQDTEGHPSTKKPSPLEFLESKGLKEEYATYATKQSDGIKPKSGPRISTKITVIGKPKKPKPKYP